MISIIVAHYANFTTAVLFNTARSGARLIRM